MKERKTFQFLRIEPIKASQCSKHEYLREYKGYEDSQIEGEDEVGYVIEEHEGVGGSSHSWCTETEFIQKAFLLSNIIGRMTFSAVVVTLMRDMIGIDLDLINKGNEKIINDELVLKDANACLQQSVLLDFLMQKLAERKDIHEEMISRSDEKEEPKDDEPRDECEVCNEQSPEPESKEEENQQ